MEQLILLCFREAVGDNEVLSRDKSLIGMELDIVIPKYKVAIEPGNWLLHQRSIKRDERKRQLCENKGLPDLEEDDIGPISYERSIGIYAPDDEMESILFGREGYYD